MLKNISSKFLVVSSLAFFSFTFLSCERCKECVKTSIVLEDGVRTTVSESIEVCGKNKDFDAYERLDYICED